MGRTKRKRNYIKLHSRENYSLDNQDFAINLKKHTFTRETSFNKQFKLYYFKDTGRGILTARKLEPKEPLINIPVTKIIHCKTLKEVCNECSCSLFDFSCLHLTFVDMLSLFLYTEALKKEHSKWRFYLDSLPSTQNELPWFYSVTHLRLKSIALHSHFQEKKSQYDESCNRIRLALMKSQRAPCATCRLGKAQNFDEDLYKWAYTIVNTRTVYFNTETDVDGVMGRVDFALCPFLDMFNHDSKVTTSAWVDGEFYVLRNNKGTNKNQQVFISYGAHDNLQLFLQYGFSLPDNVNHYFAFTLDEVLSASARQCHRQQFLFIKNHTLDKNLTVALSGISYNLKACLYVILHPDVKDWNAFVYNEHYSDQDCRAFAEICIVLLSKKIEVCKTDIEVVAENCDINDCLRVSLLQYLRTENTLLNNVISLLKIT